MKKSAIIGGFVFLLGAMIFVGSMASCGWDFSKLSTRPQFEETHLSVQNTNQAITLQDSNKPIFVGLSNDDQIHLIYFEHKKEYYEIEDGSVLKAERRTDYRWYDYIFNLDFQYPSFTILLPADFQGSLDLQTSGSKISVSDVRAKQLLCSTQDGAVSVKNFSGAEALVVKTSNSKIELSDVQLTGALDCQTSDGAVHLTDICAGTIHALTSDAAILSKNTQTSQGTTLKTTDARIEVENVGADGDLSLCTMNGKILGTIAGCMQDFSIQSKTRNGNCNLPEYSIAGDKKLEVVTSDANISIAFTN